MNHVPSIPRLGYRCRYSAEKYKTSAEAELLTDLVVDRARAAKHVAISTPRPSRSVHMHLVSYQISHVASTCAHCGLCRLRCCPLIYMHGCTCIGVEANHNNRSRHKPYTESPPQKQQRAMTSKRIRFIFASKVRNHLGNPGHLAFNAIFFGAFN